MSSTAAAPSVSGDELPAVTEPYLRSNTGLSAASASSDVSARMPLSVVTASSIAGAAEPGRDLGGEPAVGRGRGGALVALQREPVLRLARDPVLLRHLLGRLAHRLAGRRLGDRRRQREPDPAAGPAPKAASPAPEAPGLARLHQDLAESPGMEDRDVGQRLDAAGQHDVGVTQRDLVGGVGDGLGRRGAGAVEGVGRHARQELREQADLAGDVGHEQRGNDLAEDHLVHFAPVDLAPDQQLADGMTGQRDRRDFAKDRSALDERGTQAGDDGDASAWPGFGHGTPEVG